MISIWQTSSLFSGTGVLEGFIRARADSGRMKCWRILRVHGLMVMVGALLPLPLYPGQPEVSVECNRILSRSGTIRPAQLPPNHWLVRSAPGMYRALVTVSSCGDGCAAILLLTA